MTSSWELFSINNFNKLYRLYKGSSKVDRCCFFQHPLSLLLFYPEAEIRFRFENGFVLIKAKDSFTSYMPMWPWGYEGKVNDLLEKFARDDITAIKGITLSSCSNLVGKNCELVDTEFVYDLMRIKRMFRKRANIINKWKQIDGLKVEAFTQIDGGISNDMMMLLKDWIAFKKGRVLDWQFYMAESTMDIMENLFRLWSSRLSNQVEFMGLTVKLRGRLIGFSVSFIEQLYTAGRFGFNLFEFCHPDFNNVATFIFYETSKLLKRMKVRYLNTLGYSQIEALRYNKRSYKPCYLIPEYRMVIR